MQYLMPILYFLSGVACAASLYVGVAKMINDMHDEVDKISLNIDALHGTLRCVLGDKP